MTVINFPGNNKLTKSKNDQLKNDLMNGDPLHMRALQRIIDLESEIDRLLNPEPPKKGVG